MTTYEGAPQWGVRWNERGFEPKIHKMSDIYGDQEEEARSFHRFLVERYLELGRDDHPELVRATTT